MFGEDIGFIYFSNLGYCSLREFIVYCTNSEAEGEKKYIYIYTHTLLTCITVMLY